MFCKIVITLVSAWYCHYGSCTIASQYIISNPYLYGFFSKRMFCIGSRKHSRNGFNICHTVAFTTLSCCCNIGVNLLFLLWSCNFCNQFMLWRQRHKACSKNGIWSCGEDFYLSIIVFYIKRY